MDEPLIPNRTSSLKKKEFLRKGASINRQIVINLLKRKLKEEKKF